MATESGVRIDRARALEAMQKKLSVIDFHNAAWVYEFTKQPELGVVLIGAMMAIATEHQAHSFWEILGAAKWKVEMVKVVTAKRG